MKNASRTFFLFNMNNALSFCLLTEPFRTFVILIERDSYYSPNQKNNSYVITFYTE
jgi:hypothetical protein